MQNLLIELDAKVVVELVQSMSSSNAFYSSLLADCRSLLGRFQHYKVQHAFREVNRVADALAKLGCVMQDHFVILNSPSSDDISCFVKSDANGDRYCRLSTPNLVILAQLLFSSIFPFDQKNKRFKDHAPGPRSTILASRKRYIQLLFLNFYMFIQFSFFHKC